MYHLLTLELDPFRAFLARYGYRNSGIFLDGKRIDDHGAAREECY
jgi:hypothetical protein